MQPTGRPNASVIKLPIANSLANANNASAITIALTMPQMLLWMTTERTPTARPIRPAKAMRTRDSLHWSNPEHYYQDRRIKGTPCAPVHTKAGRPKRPKPRGRDCTTVIPKRIANWNV